MGRASFAQINLVSSDPDASVHFYRLLGVDIPESEIVRFRERPFHINVPAVARPRAPSFEIDSREFAAIWNPAWKGRADLAGKMLIGFWVAERSDVDAAWRDVTGAGFAGLHPPCDAFWGSRFAIVEDPDGVAVGIMSPQSDAHRSPPPLDELGLE